MSIGNKVVTILAIQAITCQLIVFIAKRRHFKAENSINWRDLSWRTFDFQTNSIVYIISSVTNLTGLFLLIEERTVSRNILALVVFDVLTFFANHWNHSASAISYLETFITGSAGPLFIDSFTQIWSIDTSKVENILSGSTFNDRGDTLSVSHNIAIILAGNTISCETDKFITKGRHF